MIIHSDGELTCLEISANGITNIASIYSHKKMNSEKGKEPVADVYLRDVNDFSFALYVFEAFGSVSVYQIMLN